MTATTRRRPKGTPLGLTVPDCEKSLVAAVYEQMLNDRQVVTTALQAFDTTWLTIPACADVVTSVAACAAMPAPNIADVLAHLRGRQKELGQPGAETAEHLLIDCAKQVAKSPQGYSLGLARYINEVEAAYRQRTLMGLAADIAVKTSQGTLDACDIDDLKFDAGLLLSVLERKQSEPEQAMQWKPFPVSLLPSGVRDYVVQTADGMACDHAMIALPMLAGLAAAIGNTRTITLTPDWQEPAIIWAAVVAESGSLKTPAARKALRFITEREPEIEDRNAIEQQEYEAEKTVYETQLAAWKQQSRKAGDIAGSPPSAPPKPLRSAYIVSDTTIEAVASILSDNPRGVLLERDELAGWMAGFDKYKSGGPGRVSSEVGHWLSMHNAGTLRLDRKSSGRVFVSRANLSITGGIQPDTLTQAIGSEHVANGLLARFLLASPPRRPKRFSTATADFAAVESTRRTFDTLYSLTVPDAGPMSLPMTHDGEVAFQSFFDRHANRQSEASGAVASMLAKIEAAAARLALIHHVCRQAGDEPTLPHAIDATSVEVGIGLAEWFADEWLRVYQSTVGGASQRDHDRELLSWIESQGGEVAVRDIGQRLRRYRDSDALDRAITAHVHARRLESFNVRNSQGGRPARWVRLPKLPAKPK